MCTFLAIWVCGLARWPGGLITVWVGWGVEENACPGCQSASWWSGGLPCGVKVKNTQKKIAALGSTWSDPLLHPPPKVWLHMHCPADGPTWTSWGSALASPTPANLWDQLCEKCRGAKPWNVNSSQGEGLG